MRTRGTLTVQQAMARCQVSRRTIYNWLRDGKLRAVRTGGRTRIVEDALWTRERAPFRRGLPPTLSPETPETGA